MKQRLIIYYDTNDGSNKAIEVTLDVLICATFTKIFINRNDK